MPTTREAILLRLAELVRSDDWFPDTAAIAVEEPQDWRPVPGSDVLEDSVAIQDGPVTVLREACGEGDTYELQLEAAIAYAVDGTDNDERRSRRDAAAPRIAALILADRTLGIDPELYAELEPSQRDDEQVFRGTKPLAISAVPVKVTYTAATPVD